ncbi:cyclophilin-like fold protein [Helicobacter suis]|uniref:cyclophilin-like fold protein n=1 Tax=Helicobacter suis TaxID=104628 RepID=UPI00249019F2|nr:cyclophilin-like fold protein [Helicobacter suis]
MLLTGFTLQAEPIFNIFELGVKSAERSLYVAVGRNNITQSVLKDKATLGMYLVQEKTNPNKTYMFEVYANQKGYQEHLKSEQYKEFLKQSPLFLTDHKKKIEVVPEYMGDKKFRQTKSIRVNYVIVGVKNGFNDAFRKVVLEEMQQSIKKEKGVYAIYAATAKDNPNKWYFFEIYKDDAAYQRHRETPHFKKYLAETADMLENKGFVDILGIELLNKGNLNYVKSDFGGKMTQQIKITMGQQSLHATLEDNSATRALIAKMPFTVRMQNLYGRELVHRLGARALPTGKLRHDACKVGDLIYWPPQGSLVILYKQNGEIFERQQLGHIEQDVSTLGRIKDIEVTFSVEP